MKRRWLPTVLAVLALAWVFAVVAFYYVAHKPFAASNLLAVGRALAGLGGATLVVALGTGIGACLLRRLTAAPTDRLILSAAVGLGVLSLLGLGLGAVGLLRPWLLWVLTLGGLVATGRSMWRTLRAAWADPAWRPQGRFEIFLALFCGVMLTFALAWALAPPTAWDALDYHLTAPKLYLETGRVSHPFDLLHLGFPQLMEMLFTWGMGLVGERAAAPIHWWYGVLGVLALVVIVRLAGWPYVDLTLLFYATLAFLALAHFLWGGLQADGWLVLSGVLAGLALSTKYTALALPPALGLSLLVSRIRRPGFALRRAILLGLVALAVWSPWLIKNLVLTGNPTYPFFFDGVYWDEYRAWWYDRPGEPGQGLAYTAPWRLLIAPWDVTVWGVEGAPLVGLPGYSATIGPLLLAGLPLLLLVWRRLSVGQRRWLLAALAFCGVLYAFWLWGVARSALLIQTRLLFPAFGLLALMAGTAVEGLRALPRRPIDLGWMMRAVVVGVLSLSLVSTALFAMRDQPLKVLLGFESEEEFLTRHLGWYHVVVNYINQDLPEDAVVLFLWEERSYHCQVTCWPDSVLDRWLHATQHLYGQDATMIAQTWREEGVTHVLLYRAGLDLIVAEGYDPVMPRDLQTLDDLLSRHATLVETFDSAYELYRLEDAR
jgi:hypothetical protein